MSSSNGNRKLNKIKMLSFIILFGGIIVLTFILGVHSILAAGGQTTAQGHLPAQGSARGLGFLAAAISCGLGVLGAGIAVAQVGAAAMGAIAEKPELMGRSLVYVGLAEGLAIYGLIVSIIILGKV